VRKFNRAADASCSLFCALILTIGLAACQPSPALEPNPINLGGGAPAVRLSVEPDEGVQPVLTFLGGARRTLDVAMYLLSDRQIITALEAAQRRGVKVRVMLEEHPYGTGPGNTAQFNQLKSAGVAVAWSPASFTLSHDKYAVADATAALLGTPNWTVSAFTSNREYLVEDTNPDDVKQLAALFEADWNRQAAPTDDPNLVLSPTNSRADFLQLIQSAQRTLDLEAEEMQDPAIESALGSAAGRGVVVRVILPAAVAAGPDANAAGRARLGHSGVQVKQLSDLYVHAKDIVADERLAFVGSENISTESLDHNREVGLLIGDPQAIQELEDTFNRDWTAATP
jgi:cardiolipin synthase